MNKIPPDLQSGVQGAVMKKINEFTPRVHSYRCTNKQTGESHISLLTELQASTVDAVIEINGLNIKKAQALVDKWNKQGEGRFFYEVYNGTNSSTPEL